MPQTFIVDRKAFLEGFLTPIIKIAPPKDYLSFEWDDGALLTLVPYENRVFLLASHQPLKNEGDGLGFYLREPNRLRDVISMVPDDLIPMRVDSSRMTSKTKGFSMNFMLIDPLVGKRGSASAITPQRAKEFEPVELFTLTKAAITRLKKTISSFRDPNVVVGFSNIDGDVWAKLEFSGEDVAFNLGVDSKKFTEFEFAATVFSMIDAKDEVVVSLDKTKKIMFMDIDRDKTQLRYIVTQRKATPK